MNPFDLAAWQEEFADYAAGRILTIGARQYDEVGVQKFERLDVQDICDELMDELADVVNYAAMIAVHVGRIKSEAERWGRVPF